MQKTLTNRMGLPEGIVQAVKNDPYNSGASDISVTRLITPPYQRKLMETVEQVEDVSDRIWSLLGQATHTILERAYPVPPGDEQLSLQDFLAKHNFLVEQRLFMPVVGATGKEWILSGAFDAYERETLFDYKVTSVYAVMGEIKKEWTQQLNLLRLLAIRHGIEVKQLRIIALLRDWSKMKAKLDRDYPQAQVVPVEIEVWDTAVAEQYLMERVTLHQGDDPEPCTAVDRWQRDDVYAVMKEGRKSAVKLHDNANTANDQRDLLGKGHTVVKRPGDYIRCANYCAVSHACPHHQGEVAF